MGETIESLGYRFEAKEEREAVTMASGETREGGTIKRKFMRCMEGMGGKAARQIVNSIVMGNKMAIRTPRAMTSSVLRLTIQMLLRGFTVQRVTKAIMTTLAGIKCVNWEDMGGTRALFKTAMRDLLQQDFFTRSQEKWNEGSYGEIERRGLECWEQKWVGSVQRGLVTAGEGIGEE